MHSRGVSQVRGRLLGVVIERLTILHEEVRAELDPKVLLLEVHARVPRGARQSAPVGIVPEDGRFRQRRRHHGPRDDASILEGLRTSDVALDEAGGALAVPRDGLGDSDAHRRQRRLQFLSLRRPGNDCVSPRRARRETHDAVVGARVAVDGDLVERVMRRALDHGAPTLGLDDGVARDDSQHGGHVRMDHAAALAHASDAHLLPAEDAAAAAEVNLHGERLANQVRGADGGRRGVRGLLGGLEVSRERGHRAHELVHLDALADDSGGLEQHVVGVASESLRDGGGGADRVLHAEHAGRGVSLTGVGEDRADRPLIGLGEDFAAVLHGSRGDSVLGEDAADHGGFVGDDEAAVRLILTALAQLRLERGRLEPFGGADAAVDDLPRAARDEILDGRVRDGKLVGFVIHGGGFGVGGGPRDEDVRATEGNDVGDASLLGGVSDASRGRELRRDGADGRVHGGAWANLERFFSPLTRRSEVAVAEEAHEVAEDSVDGGVPGTNDAETRSRSEHRFVRLRALRTGMGRQSRCRPRP